MTAKEYLKRVRSCGTSAEKKRACKYIDRLTDERHRDILKMHYIHHKTFSYIADCLNYTLRHITRLHQVALNELDRLVENKDIMCVQ